VSKPAQVAKLRALLVRVVSRAAEPRTKSRPVVPIAGEAPAAFASSPVLDDEITLAQPVPLLAPPPAPRPTESDVVLEVDVVEVAGETVIGIPAEEVMAPEALGSRERLVAAEPIASEIAELLAASELPELTASEEEPAPELLADESDVEEAAELDEAPLSSRRPVEPEPEERLAEMAFGAEEPPPRHTPPPESGRLPAAPAGDFDADVTGVREATPIAPVRAQEHEVAAVVATLPPPARELVPETTRAALPAGDVVVDVVGQAQRFQPSTFVALLEASLEL